ncbi:hypothetical protein DICPUDRAFT_75314 [Dictyostelium purpureum]|uniref:Nudix hydrolase domain-containing protein n=1 Tax=Dictyostelium purpureum TaxID=5786 RepID=F0ZAB1_DICPU|nr:uncharacterized protein DICPUDRAFT_75314 [Dictyostelium purpureum]EGC39119.1 hypothetical protein DICPUDRAFT_75314 [Dictyostelium purpureum]|eukprot:XP_003284371.1 hypothetical protein DICPUDRAFT_75314 [Dictyostelium purpureum]
MNNNKEFGLLCKKVEIQQQQIDYLTKTVQKLQEQLEWMNNCIKQEHKKPIDDNSIVSSNLQNDEINFKNTNNYFENYNDSYYGNNTYTSNNKRKSDRNEHYRNDEYFNNNNSNNNNNNNNSRYNNNNYQYPEINQSHYNLQNNNNNNTNNNNNNNYQEQHFNTSGSDYQQQYQNQSYQHNNLQTYTQQYQNEPQSFKLIPNRIERRYKSSGVVLYAIDNYGNIKILLGCEDLSKKKDYKKRQDKCVYTLLGGKRDRTEKSIDTAMRELNEETNFIFNDTETDRYRQLLESENTIKYWIPSGGYILYCAQIPYDENIPKRFRRNNYNNYNNNKNIKINKKESESIVSLEWIDYSSISSCDFRNPIFIRSNGERGELYRFFIEILNTIYKQFELLQSPQSQNNY